MLTPSSPADWIADVHHETCDLDVDSAAPLLNPDTDPMQGNVALPYLCFRPGGHLGAFGLPLRVVRRERRG